MGLRPRASMLRFPRATWAYWRRARRRARRPLREEIAEVFG